MKTFQTTEEHKLLVEHDPKGLWITVIPKDPPLDDGVLDVFGLGINFANLVRAIREIDLPLGFRGEGWDSSMRRINGRICFQFSYKHAPLQKFETSLSAPDSSEFIGILENSVNGTPNISIQGATEHSVSKTGRNDPCPCGSGKKMKKCCNGALEPKPLPAGLEAFRGVRDPLALNLRKEAHQTPEVLGIPDFWDEFGCALGSAEDYPLALVAFEKALELDPGNPGILSNYAATLGAAGNNAEALEILQKLPNETGQFSVLIGNSLCNQGQLSEAVPYYEQAINFEPEFSFPYEKLLWILKTSGHPLYEYWVRRAQRELPSNPAIALAYSHWLIGENRLEELAKADWVDCLEHNPDPRVMGRRHEDPQRIVEVQVLRLIAQSLVQESAAPLENAAKVLEAAPAQWHRCVPAEQLALAARFFGRRDLVWKASRLFCQKCQINRLGSVTLRTLLAQSAIATGDTDQAIRDAEAGLKERPEELALRNVYWWALDDVGRSDEALEVAKGVQAEISDLPHICYNIGYMAGKLGKPATAITYYTKEIEKGSNHPFAFENLAMHRLLEGDVSAARALVNQWSDMVSADSDAMQLAAKESKFELLATFVQNNAGSVSLSFDLQKLNQTTEPFFGAETKVPPDKPTREDIVAALTSTDPNRKHEITYMLEMEQRGDHSIVVAALEEELPGIRDLPSEAFMSIVEAQSQLGDNCRPDFAPCCMAFCKCLEISIFNLVFQAFRTYALALGSINESIEQAAHPDFEKANSFVRFVSKGAPLELGTMAFTLNLCRGKTAKKMTLLALLREWTESNGYGHLIDQGTPDEIAEIAKDYRNPAAHSKTFSRDDATAAKRLCLNQLTKLLIPLHNQLS
jgi:tetratricopeptide (TPR) repeat protein